MEIADFFDFSSKLVSSTFHVSAMGLPNDGQLELIVGHYTDIQFPVVFIHTYGSKLMDLMDTGYPPCYLISNRLKIIFEENELTGWKCYPIRIFDKKKNEIFGYHGFSITGRCGPIDDKKATIIEKPNFPGGPVCKFYKGLYVGLDQWDGTDFFIPQESTWPIITKRTADILKKNKITNMSLENLADIERLTFDKI